MKFRFQEPAKEQARELPCFASVLEDSLSLAKPGHSKTTKGIQNSDSILLGMGDGNDVLRAVALTRINRKPMPSWVVLE